MEDLADRLAERDNVEVGCLGGELEADLAECSERRVDVGRRVRLELGRRSVLEERDGVFGDRIEVAQAVGLLKAAEELERVDLGVHGELAQALAGERGNLAHERRLARCAGARQDGKPPHVQALDERLKRLQRLAPDRQRRAGALDGDRRVVPRQQRVADLDVLRRDERPRARQRVDGLAERVGEEARHVVAVATVAKPLQVQEAKVLDASCRRASRPVDERTRVNQRRTSRKLNSHGEPSTPNARVSIV